jgi:cell wall-associated NlpC family hydrolase/DNA-directed RNA polymerase subunit N (RpoN/RPB10)
MVRWRRLIQAFLAGSAALAMTVPAGLPASAASGAGEDNPQGVDAAGHPRQFGTTAAESAGAPITRAEIVARAQTWYAAAVPYSMNAYRDGYRTDCSGYVSMAWHTNGNFWTGDLDTIGVPIGYNDLRPGDMLLYHNTANPVNGSHVVIFDHWTGAVGGDFMMYEQTKPSTKHRPWSEAGYSRSLYKPYRYTNVVESSSFGGVAAADVNGDGRADVVARKPDGALLLYPNTGNNTAPYSAGATIGSSWQGFRTVTAGDVNDDGRADLLAVGSDGSLVQYLNNGSASFPYSAGTVVGSGWQGFTSVIAADVNGDARADLLAVGGDGSLRQYVNTGSDTAPFSSGAVIGDSWQGFRQVMAGDVNGDHKADLLAIGTDGSLRQYLNNGSASFPYSASAVIGSGWNFRTVMAGDVTGDGRADLMTVSTDGTLRLYTNTGNDTGPYGANIVIGTGWNSFA